LNFFAILFRNRHVDWLEKETFAMMARHAAAALQTQEKHEKEIARIESLNQIIQYEAMRELAETKKSHASELNRVIEENQRLRDDVKRLQFLAIPALKNVELEPDKTPPPSPDKNAYLGTPWQRVLAREIELQERAAKERFTRPVPAEGASDGSSGEGRVEAPLGEQGKPA
jgi:Asp-tRNA(Asn)/Glu-tRNA(Gln) amidotransferase C subunit